MIALVIEGTRVLLLEIQALTSESSFSVPRRLSTGIELNRILLLIAVLEKKMNLSLGKNDIHFNIVGGLKVDDRGLDLGIVLTLISSIYNIPINKNLLAVGEIGLTGELRGVLQLDQRLKECQKQGFEKIIIPKIQSLKTDDYKMEIIEVESLKEAVSYFMKNNKGGKNEA